MPEETVTLTKDEYKILVDNNSFLSCLFKCGVDNWEGYDEAQEMMEIIEKFNQC